jgi:hypothetical protein
MYCLSKQNVTVPHMFKKSAFSHVVAKRRLNFENACSRPLENAYLSVFSLITE